MRTLILAALLALPMASQAGCNWTLKNDDMQFRADKRVHLTHTAAGVFALKALNDATGFGASNAQIFWLGVLPGFVHEVTTACNQNHPRAASERAFSHQDMVYNMIGAAIGVGLGEGVRVMLGKDSAAIEWSF